MQSPPSSELTDTQVDQLEEFLDSIDGAMDLETVDGFFCALISGPDPVKPSEYLPYVFGGEMSDFSSAEQTAKIMELLFQHWNHIADILLRGEFYFPLLFEDEAGKCHANEWAHGYMLGAELRRESWSGLIGDEEDGGLMVPVMALHFEHDDDPEFGPSPILDDRREDIITHMIAAILGVYRHFAPERMKDVQQPIQHQHPKIGRNDPCYCGSGKKYKDCHGVVTLH
jgi:uncharacterized protein